MFLDLHLENMESLGEPQNSERWKGLQNGDSAHSDLDLKHLQLSLAARYLINLKKKLFTFPKYIQALWHIIYSRIKQ